MSTIFNLRLPAHTYPCLNHKVFVQNISGIHVPEALAHSENFDQFLSWFKDMDAGDRFSSHGPLCVPSYYYGKFINDLDKLSALLRQSLSALKKGDLHVFQNAIQEIRSHPEGKRFGLTLQYFGLLADQFVDKRNRVAVGGGPTFPGAASFSRLFKGIGKAIVGLEITQSEYRNIQEPYVGWDFHWEENHKRWIGEIMKGYPDILKSLADCLPESEKKCRPMSSLRRTFA